MCTVHRILGCTILFEFHGTKSKADSSYWWGTGYTKEACEANCALDVSCYGFMYNSYDLKCTKSGKTESEDDEYCTTCSFSSKQCGTDCPSTFKEFGTYKKSKEPYAFFDISISECKAQCSSGVRCLGFGYNSATSRCYLSEYNSPESEEHCSTCTFSRKECTANSELDIVTNEMTSSDTSGITEPTVYSIHETGCTILFKFHGTSLKTDTSYWSGTGYTKEACEANCALDVSCYGYMYSSNDLKCTKSGKTESEDDEYCTTCSFSSKQCGTDCPNTYKEFGTYKKSNEPYAFFDINISDCKAQCFSDVRCLGFGYNSAISRCYLSENNSPESEEECSTCTFSRKECNASFDVKTTTNSELDIVTSIITSSNTVGITSGITELTEYSIHQTTTTTATNASIKIKESTIQSSESTIPFTESTSDITTKISEITTGESTSTGVSTSIIASSTLTTDEPMSTGESTSTIAFSLRASTSKGSSTATAESTSKGSFTSTGRLTSAVILTSDASTLIGVSTATGVSTSTALALPVEPTTIPERLSSVTMYFPNKVNETSTLCLCRCVYENSTSLQERITERKDDLRLKNQELSSFQRRMTCAHDARNTSKVIGGGGIFVISFIISLIIIPDILTTIIRLTRNKRKHKVSFKSEQDKRAELTNLG